MTEMSSIHATSSGASPASGYKTKRGVTCRNGHPISESYRMRGGGMRCRTCRRETYRRSIAPALAARAELRRKQEDEVSARVERCRREREDLERSRTAPLGAVEHMNLMVASLILPVARAAHAMARFYELFEVVLLAHGGDESVDPRSDDGRFDYGVGEWEGCSVSSVESRQTPRGVQIVVGESFWAMDHPGERTPWDRAALVTDGSAESPDDHRKKTIATLVATMRTARSHRFARELEEVGAIEEIKKALVFLGADDESKEARG